VPKRLSALPIDTFLLAMAATVALAALLPARGAAAEVLSAAAKAVIALLFWLYGARLSPQQAWQGVKRWQLHLLVLATTFVVFPVLGLAARGLVPWLLNLDLYNGLLFLCLVPSTVQSFYRIHIDCAGQRLGRTRQRIAVQHRRGGADAVARRAADGNQRRHPHGRPRDP
jgi:predicted Na+-dependent transporter